MTFANPIWLYLTPVIVVIIAGLILFGLRRRDTLLGRFAAPRLLPQLTERAGNQRTIVKAALIAVALGAIGLALARPQYGVEWTERKARGLDIIFVLDTSRSMLATDLRPNRLDRAKLAVRDLVERLESDRIGLIAFAGRSFLLTPPTLDYAAFRESLNAVNTEAISLGGSDIGGAMREAANAFPSDNNFRVVVLLTDGEDLGGDAVPAARETAEKGITVHAIGIGTPEGEYLKVRNPDGSESFVRDPAGQPVRTQLDESTLQEIAAITGGSYSRMTDRALRTLYNEVFATLPRAERESELQEMRIERFQWLLSLAVIFLVLEILIRNRSGSRRGPASAALLLCLTLPWTPNVTEAQATPAAPSNVEARDSQNTPIAESPADPRQLYNRATEALTAGDYATALDMYSRALESTRNRRLQRDILYNMAHAVHQTGDAALRNQDLQTAVEKWKAAEGLFQSAHEIDPSDTAAIEDAQKVEARRQRLEEIIEEQEQQEPPQQEPQRDQQDQQDQQDPKDPADPDAPEGDETQQQDPNGDSQQEDPAGDSPQQDADGDRQQQNPDAPPQDAESGSDPSPGEEQPQPETDTGEPAPGEEPTEGAESEAEAPTSSDEQSTRDPIEDFPQPQPGEEGGEGPEEESDATGPPTPEEMEGGPEGATDASAADGEAVEGFSEAEARALLDSLRGNEKLLPFTDGRQDGPRRDFRDW